MSYTPGYGDEATWGECYGHPHDPRTPEFDDDEELEQEDKE